MDCPTCNKPLESKADGVNCDGPCAITFHANCLKVKKRTLQDLRASDQLQWYCTNCVKYSTKNLLKELTISNQSVQSLTSVLETSMADSLEEVSETNQSVRALTSLLEQTLMGSLNQIKDIADSLVSTHSASQQSTQRNIHDLPSANKRQRNDNQYSSTNAPPKPPLPSLSFGRKGATSSLQAVAGTTNNPLLAAHMPKPCKQIYVTRLPPLTTTDNVIAYLLENDLISKPEDCRCIKLVPLAKDISTLTFVSFKIGVFDQSTFEAIMNVDNWSDGIGIREFVDTPKEPRDFHNAKKMKLDTRTPTPTETNNSTTNTSPLLGSPTIKAVAATETTI